MMHLPFFLFLLFLDLSLGQLMNCPQHETMEGCFPCFETCSDFLMGKKCLHGCLPRQACHCVPGFARLFPGGPCIPELRCDHPFERLRMRPIPSGDPFHRIAHHDLPRRPRF